MRKILPVCVMLVMVLAVFSAVTGKVGVVEEIEGFPPGWTDDIQLTFIPGLGSNARPTITTNGDTIHLVWNNNTDGHLGYCRSEDAGRTWTEPKVITSGNVAWDSRLAVNGSHIHLVYDKDYGTSFEIVYQNSTDNGKTWNTPVMLTPSDGITSQLADIAVEGDTVHVVWEDWGGGMEIMYRNSTDGGKTWNPTIPLTSYPGGSDTEAKIAVNSSIVHITWGRFVTGTGTFETMYLRSLDGGSTWEAEKQISLPGSGHSEPSDLAVNGSSVYVIWMDSRNGAWETYINVSHDDGVTWNGGIGVTDIDGRNSFGAYVDVWNETVYVVWGDPRDDYPYPEAHEAYMNYSFDGGVTWQSSNERLQFALNNSGPMDIVLTENYVHVALIDNRTGKKEIYYKRYPDFPADTTQPTIIHTPVIGTPIGQPINITAEVSDNVALSGVWLNYTGVNGTNYNVSMTGWNQKKVMVSGLGQTLYTQDGNYSFEIPAQTSEGVLSYYIWAEDVYGNGAKAPVDGMILIGTPAQTNLTLQYGWNLISFPVEQPKLNGTSIIRASDIVNVTGSIEVAIWNATDQNYSYYLPGFHDPWDPENFFIGEDDALFVWMDDNATYLVEGYEPGSRNVTLKPGWNMVAYKNTSVGDVGTLWADKVSAGAYDDICYYDGQTFRHYIYPGTEMQLVPTRGYFVWSDFDTWLTY